MSTEAFSHRFACGHTQIIKIGAGIVRKLIEVGLANREECNGCFDLQILGPEKMERAHRARQEEIRELAALERRATFSIARHVKCIRRRLEKSGLDFCEEGNGSHYFFFKASDGEKMKIRVSDHQQPVGGGYKGLDPLLGDVRHGEADLSVDPSTGLTWKNAWTFIVEKTGIKA